MSQSEFLWSEGLYKSSCALDLSQLVNQDLFSWRLTQTNINYELYSDRSTELNQCVLPGLQVVRKRRDSVYFSPTQECF